MQTRTKTRTKTRTRTRTNRSETPLAGEAIAAGGFGCVFKPAIRCKNSTTRKDGVSKLLLNKDANEEMSEIRRVKPYLSKIKNFQNFFLIDGISKCLPGLLDAEDKKQFDKKCKNLTSEGIDAGNVNSYLGKLGQINMPDGGIAGIPWLEKEPLTYTRMALYNNLLINLLENGVVPMNNEGVLHEM